MYSVSKPELTFYDQVNMTMLSVMVNTPLGDFTGVSYLEYANTIGILDEAYNQAVAKAYELMTDALAYQSRFISSDTHVSKEPDVLWVGLRPEQPGDNIIKPPDMMLVGGFGTGPIEVEPVESRRPTKVAAKPDDKVGSTLFCRDCEQEITDYVSGTAVMPAAQVAQMTLGRWKRQLCAACSVVALKKR